MGPTRDRRRGDEVSTHLPYLLEVELRKGVQPVGQLAQVEKLHLEAGGKGGSHTGGLESNVPVVPAEPRRERQGSRSKVCPCRTPEPGDPALQSRPLKGRQGTGRGTGGERSAEDTHLPPGEGRLRRQPRPEHSNTGEGGMDTGSDQGMGLSSEGDNLTQLDVPWSCGSAGAQESQRAAS